MKLITKEFSNRWHFNVSLLTARSLSVVLFAFLFFFTFSQISCTSIFGKRQGKLTVLAKGDGTYEIYKISGERPLQLISETIGEFNKQLKLDPGSYLLLADCSSELVVIHPQSAKTLIADRVEFVAPKQARLDRDSFIIHCNRYEQMQNRQRLVNKFSLDVLRGEWDLLVAMSPLALRNNLDSASRPNPETISYNLSAVRVENLDPILALNRYFVSLFQSLVSVTESQALGSWLFLLPGRYTMELNGSRMSLDLAESQVQTINPGYLRVESPKELSLDQASSIQGNPLSVEINGGHLLSLNSTYPVLPGEIGLKLTGSVSEKNILVEGGELAKIPARALTVQLDCPPWDWACLGSRKIFLYDKKSNSPFAQGFSDVPLLFFEEDAWVVIEGARDIRCAIKHGEFNTYFRTARIVVQPKPEIKSGWITDLLRLESIGSECNGNTLDFALEQQTSLFVISGQYQLAQYNSLTNTDGDRRKHTKRIYAESNSKQEHEVVVYFSERKPLPPPPPTEIDQERTWYQRRLTSLRIRPALPVGAR